MKNAIIVFKKEFYRVISDRRLLFTTILLPGLIIYLMYSLMGNAISNELEDVEQHTMIVYTSNMPESISTMLESDPLTTEEDDKRTVLFTEVTDDMEFSEIEEKILNGEIDLYVDFEEGFEQAIASYDSNNPTVPYLNTYYNPGENYSDSAYSYFITYMNVYKTQVLNTRFQEGVLVYNQDLENENHMIFNEEESIGKGFAGFLPMIIIMFLFSGAMSIGPDSIAGEKERGTIATLLVTPVKRSEIAIGKVLSLSVIALLSAVSSFAGILLSLPKLMNMGDSVNTNIYGLTEYIQILVILLATVLVIIGIVSVVSAFAKTIKEAGMLILPFYFISIIIGVTSMFNSEAAESAWMYLIPLYSSVNMLIGILTFNVVPLHFTLTVVSSVVYVAILIYIMNKLFSNEKIMFSK